ncbi:hypothetical protein D3C74_244620 [compost metagenome]
MNLERILQGFDERMRNIAVFSSIINLQEKTRYSEYSNESAGLATLLFILDNMLSNTPTTTESLTMFLQTLLSERCDIHLSIEQASEYRLVLVREFLRNDGAPHKFSYYSFETKSDEVYAFHLIEYDNLSISELKEDRSNIKLTDKGLEFLFKTKEMYNELQISITQLYFKQQMQKGLFNEALKAAIDMIGLIQSEKSKMRSLRSDIMRDALGVSKRQELEQRLSSAHDKMEREREMFRSLKGLVDEKLTSYYNGELTEKEEKGLDLIHEIHRKIQDAMSIHESLFEEKQRLQYAMTNALESLILHAFSVKLNFEREVLQEVVRTGANLDALKQIINPLMPLRIPSYFNPAVIFSEQKRQVRKQEREIEVPVVDEDLILQIEMEEKEKERLRLERISRYLRIVLLPLLENDKIHISTVLDNLKEENEKFYQEITNQSHFCSFLVDLHQSDYNKFDRIKQEIQVHLPTLSRCLAQLVDEYPDLQPLGHFSFRPTDNIITFDNGFKLSDFVVERGDLYAISKK